MDTGQAMYIKSARTQDYWKAGKLLRKSKEHVSSFMISALKTKEIKKKIKP